MADVQLAHGFTPEECLGCNGSGLRLAHTEACRDPLCVVGIDGCEGRMVECLHQVGSPPLHRCWYCGEEVERPTWDHQVPRSRGGTDDEENLVRACPSCNSGKRDRTVEEHRATVERQRGEPVVFYGER